MRQFICFASIFALCACGLESAGTAAAVGKLQADQAKQAKENMDTLKANLDASMKATEQSAKKAEDAGNQ